MKIKFHKDADYPQNDKAQSKSYKAGETHDLPDDQAQRWLRRGVASEVTPETEAADKAAAKAAGSKPKAMVPGTPEKP